MGDSRRILKNFVGVVTSNLTTIISGVLISFLVPKILSVADYGSYKTFTLYLSYIGFFSLGIIDGIVLKFGDKDYDQIDRFLFRSFFRWYFLIHVFFAIIICFVSILCLKEDNMVIGFLVAIDMIAVNVTGYFQQISQITQRFGEYSLRKILQSVFNILAVLLLYILFYYGNSINHIIYILMIIFINIGLTIWYICTYKDIVFGDQVRLGDSWGQVLQLIRIGFPLLFANLCSSLILTVDKQFVSLLFDVSEYAVYAFAYNMLSLVTVATSAIATVLYPTLKRTNIETLRDTYDVLISSLLTVVFMSLLLYFPLCPFVKWFLPQYTESLVIFRIIFPGLAISSSVTVVMHNYYKILDKNLLFFKRSIFVLALSCVANSIAYYFFHSTVAISLASIVTMVFWYIYIESEFVKENNYSRKKNLFFAIISMVGFYSITAFFEWYIGAILYIAFEMMIVYFFCWKNVKCFISQIKH